MYVYDYCVRVKLIIAILSSYVVLGPGPRTCSSAYYHHYLTVNTTYVYTVMCISVLYCMIIYLAIYIYIYIYIYMYTHMAWSTNMLVSRLKTPNWKKKVKLTNADCIVQYGRLEYSIV